MKIRAKVFIDSDNIHFSLKNHGIKINYRRLLFFIQLQLNQIFATKIDLELPVNFYTGLRHPVSPKRERFFTFLRGMGCFDVKTRPLKGGINVQVKGNTDIMLAVDAVLLKDDYDIFVLIGGDGDYAYLIKQLKGIGKDIVVFTEPSSIGYELKNIPGIHLVNVTSEENLLLFTQNWYERLDRYLNRVINKTAN